MRILTITHNYPPTRYIGAELYDHALHKQLIKDGHEVQVRAVRSPEVHTYEGVTVNHKIEGEYDAIIVHVDNYQEATHVRRVHNLLKVPIIGIQHNFTSRTLRDEKFYKFDGMIYNSSHMLKGSRNKTPNKTVLIPPCKRPSTQTTTGEAVMIVGLAKEKGSGLFYKLAQRLEDTKFIAIEGGWGQNRTFDYPNVEFVGQTDNLKPYYLRASTLLVPSWFESWSMSAAEAIGYGVNVVTFDDLPGVAENLGDAATYLPRLADIKKWEEALENTLPPAVVKKQAEKNFRKHNRQLKATVEWLETLTTPIETPLGA